jgi:hypothetical protein
VFTAGKGHGIVRPFSTTAAVDCRGYSRPLQRIITDFGADVPFGQIPAKLHEHHGITVPVSSAQAITQRHAEQRLEMQLSQLKTEMPEEDGVACLIVEMDGSMIPIVTTEAMTVDGEPIDRRTTRQIAWQEARLALARTPEQAYPVFGATLGSTDAAGNCWPVPFGWVWDKTPMCMAAAMVRPGLPTKLPSDSVNPVAICGISTICATIWAMPVPFVRQTTPQRG